MCVAIFPFFSLGSLLLKLVNSATSNVLFASLERLDETQTYGRGLVDSKTPRSQRQHVVGVLSTHNYGVNFGWC